MLLASPSGPIKQTLTFDFGSRYCVSENESERLRIVFAWPPLLGRFSCAAFFYTFEQESEGKDTTQKNSW